MDIHFLGGATTVTGSRFLLTTSQARVLIDCGMFQGSPNESIRNRIPLGFDPLRLDAIVLTHAHLDHCGLLPVAVREGYEGPIYATAGTRELARLVLLDAGRLNEEFAKRNARWERRHPDRVAADDRRQAADYEAAVELAGDDPDEAAAVELAGDDPDEAAGVETVPIGEGVEAPGLRPRAGIRRHDPETALRSQPAEMYPDLDAPLYTEQEAEAVLPLFRSVKYGDEQTVAPGVSATFLDAGHILGSAIIRLRVREGRAAERVIVFSGDLGRPGTPIVRDPTSIPTADYVIVESTYGGREHEPHDQAIRLLAEVVRLVGESDGVLLVPSFAIGRTQEIVWELDRLIERGEIPRLRLYLDSPMASKATDIYRGHPEYWDEETRGILQRRGSPLDYPDQVIVRTVRQSQAIARSPRPYMIVASNGMLTGGRVVNHLRNLIDDPGAVLLFVGYQGEGTMGAHLQAGARTVKLDGQVRQVRCRIRSISGFSAHADEPELLDWLSSFTAGRAAGQPGYPRRVFLVHGDPDAQLALAPKVQALGLDAYVPRWHERISLD